MSYSITLYFSDPNIDEINISSPYFSYTGYYGESNYFVDEITFSVEFTATPADGCEFSRWVYRLGSTSGDVQYSYDNPFTYDGDENIYIRAEGKSSSAPAWTRHTGAFGNISSLAAAEISLGEYEIYRYSVSFAESGTACFYSEGTEVDVCGYLSTSSGWDSENGEPSSYLAYNDDGNGAPNFAIQYDVVSDQTYYVWLRACSPDASGSVTLYVDPPGALREDPVWELSSSVLGTITENTAISLSIASCGIIRCKVSFANSGTASFYTTGSTDTFGYLTTTATFDSTTGVPDSYVAKDDDSGDESNFSISWDVTVGQSYYIWVRGYSASITGNTTLNIIAPGTASRPSDFSWNSEKNQGETFNLSAGEWNDFTAKINAFRNYKGLGDYAFTEAYSGDVLMAYMYNEARLAIQEIDGYGTYIPTVSSGNQISAYMMNVLASELNAIP